MKTIKTTTRTVIIDGQEIPMRISGATVIFYKNEFKKDLFNNLSSLSNAEIKTDEKGNPIAMTIPEDAVETLLEVGYIMAKQGNPKLKETFVEWLDQFSFEAITSDAISEIAMMLQNDQKTLEKPKKNNEEQSDE